MEYSDIELGGKIARIDTRTAQILASDNSTCDLRLQPGDEVISLLFGLYNGPTLELVAQAVDNAGDPLIKVYPNGKREYVNR